MFPRWLQARRVHYLRCISIRVKWQPVNCLGILFPVRSYTPLKEGFQLQESMAAANKVDIGAARCNSLGVPGVSSSQALMQVFIMISNKTLQCSSCNQAVFHTELLPRAACTLLVRSGMDMACMRLWHAICACVPGMKVFPTWCGTDKVQVQEANHPPAHSLAVVHLPPRPHQAVFVVDTEALHARSTQPMMWPPLKALCK